MGGRDRPAHRCHDLTTTPPTAQPEDPEVEEPAPAGSSPTPTLRTSSRSTTITDDESSPVDQGSALGFRNLTNYIARSLLESGGFRPQLHPRL